MVHDLSHQRRLTCYWASLLLAATAACQGPALESDGRRADRAGELRHTGLEHVGKETKVSTPPELRLAYLRARQSKAGPEYKITRVRDATGYALKGNCSGHNLGLRLSRQGLEIVPQREGKWRFNLRLTGYGSEGRVRPVSEAAPLALGNRVEYQRHTSAGSLTEWYVNGPAGVEQGFAVPSPPAASRGGLVLELAMDGNLSAVVSDDGQSVSLRTVLGEWVLAYRDLFAEDASGRRLPARMEARGENLRLHVDDEGAVYPIAVDPWVQQQNLSARDAEENAFFGGAVAISGDTALIGAFGDNEKGLFSGAAYVFARSGTMWSEQQKLTASDGAPMAYFGFSVAVSGGTALVGAFRDNGMARGGGAAYAFVRNGNTWSEQQKLTASNGTEWDLFGSSVALSGDTALIGARLDDEKGQDRGAAYVFTRRGATWSEEQKLTPSDSVSVEDFGVSVALDGDTALVGAYGAGNVDVGSPGVSGVYVFVRSGDTWSEQQKLTAEDSATIDSFGGAVALDGNTAVVGAERYDYGGSAYVFARRGTTWSEQQELAASDGADWDRFGGSVALSGDTVLVGAKTHDEQSGLYQSAYVFVRNGTIWSEQQKLTVGDGGARSSDLGVPVALGGDTALVGDGELNHYAGSAYVFTLSAVSCASAEDCAEGNCVDGYCCDTPCGGGANPCQVCSRAKGARANGVCTITAGASCDDGIACTKEDVCDLSGTCGGTAYSCTPGQCEVSSTCDGTGCSPAYKPAGTGCDDGNACSKDDVCDALGACAGTPFTCTPTECEASSTCDGTGCTVTNKAAGASCAGGTCQAGMCVAFDGGTGTLDAGGARDAGATSDASAAMPDGSSIADGGNLPALPAPRGCSCHVAGPPGGAGNRFFMLLALAVLGLRLRRARRRTVH